MLLGDKESQAGTVLTNELVDSRPKGSFVLLSDRSRRTEKWLQAVAAAISCLKHEWVIACCQTNKLVAFG